MSNQAQNLKSKNKFLFLAFGFWILFDIWIFTLEISILVFNHRQNIILFNDQIFFFFDFDFVGAVFLEQHLLADLDGQGNYLALFVLFARTHEIGRAHV